MKFIYILLILIVFADCNENHENTKLVFSFSDENIIINNLDLFDLNEKGLKYWELKDSINILKLEISNKKLLNKIRNTPFLNSKIIKDEDTLLVKRTNTIRTLNIFSETKHFLITDLNNKIEIDSSNGNPTISLKTKSKNELFYFLSKKL